MKLFKIGAIGYLIAFVVIVGSLGFAGVKYTISSSKTADVSLWSIIKNDLSPDEENRLKNAFVSQMESDFEKFIPKENIFSFLEFNIDGVIPEENKNIYQEVEDPQMTGDKLIEFMEENDKFHQDALRKAIKDAESFNDTTLKDARDQGIENAGGVDQ